MDYTITVGGNLTSFVFYKEVVARLHSYFAEENQARILFDFSHIKIIDPLVLPNLLCAGYWICAHRGTPAKIFIPGNLEFTALRTFLNRTGFVNLAQTYGLFEFDEGISGGVKDSAPGSVLSRLELFQSVYQETDGAEDIDVNRTKEAAWFRLKDSFVPFIRQSLGKGGGEYILAHRDEISSDLLSFCRELIENALLHGRSFCFLDMQYLSAPDRQVKISVSDCGVGFKRSINVDRRRSQEILRLQREMQTAGGAERERLAAQVKRLLEQCYPLRQDPPERDDVARLAGYPCLNCELEGIVYGLLSRRQKPYGLYNIHKKIIHNMEGTIRVHSNDTQLILSERMWAPLEVCQEPGALLELLAGKDYAPNVRTGLMFKGTHIELEFKLGERKEVGA